MTMTNKTKFLFMIAFVALLTAIYFFGYNNGLLERPVYNVYNNNTYLEQTYPSTTVYNTTVTNDNNVYQSFIKFSPRKYRPCRDPMEYTVSGQSMMFLTNDKGKLYVDKVTAKDVELGDVISFANKNNFEMLHAVVYVNKEAGIIQTAGYNNLVQDEDNVDFNKIHYRYCDLVK